MEDEADGGGESFVLRSGVRAGLKREFAFAIASQAVLSSSYAPLGRTRRSSRILNPSAASTPSVAGAAVSTSSSSTPDTKPKAKRPRPPDPPPPPPSPPPPDYAPAPGEDHDGAAVGPVLALMAAAGPSPPPTPLTPQPHADADADPAHLANIIIPPESSPRRITRSMLQPKSPLPTAARSPDNAAPLKPKLEPPEEEDGKPVPALRRFTRSLLVKDKDSNDDDLSGTTTASNASSPSPNTNTTSTSRSSNKGNKNTNKIPTNLRELLATGMLEGQPVKYIMRKGKVCMSPYSLFTDPLLNRKSVPFTLLSYYKRHQQK